MNITPTPMFTAWLYASARWHPGWRLVFGPGGGEVVQVNPNAPSLIDIQRAYADAHPAEMRRFEALPQEWSEITEEHKGIILGGAVTEPA